MSSLKSLRKKKKEDAEGEEEEKGGEETPTTPTKKGGLFDKFTSSKKNATEKSDDGDDDDSEGKSPKSTPSRFRNMLRGRGKSDKKDKDKDKDKGDEKDNEDDSDDDEEEEEEEEEEKDENQPPRKGKGKKGKKKKKKKSADTEAVQESNIQNLGFMRRQPKEKLEKRLRERVRIVADNMPEVHFIGEVMGGTGFGTGVSCKWNVEFGKYWDLLSGEYIGQSQYGHADVDDMISWNHPIDLHMATSSMQGWPRIRLQIWELDEFGRTNLSGYGFAHMPTTPGTHEIAVACWRPTGSLPEEIQSFFLGTNPQLTNDDVLFSKAWENRCRLVTVPSGKVWIQVSVVHRFFQDQQVDLEKTV